MLCAQEIIKKFILAVAK